VTAHPSDYWNRRRDSNLSLCTFQGFSSFINLF